MKNPQIHLFRYSVFSEVPNAIPTLPVTVNELLTCLLKFDEF